MKKMAVQFTGHTPILMHNPRMVDKEFEICRQIKSITDKRKKTDEDMRTVERLEWYGGLYHDGDTIIQPTSKMRKCLINTAKISKLGKAVERAVSFSELHVPLEYEGPSTVDELFEDKKYHARMSVGVGNKRVMRVRPKFMPWRLTATVLFMEDAGLNEDEFVRIVELAGVVEGIGDARSIGFGRFEGKVL